MNRAKLYKRLEKLHKKHDKFIKAFRTERSEILVKIAHSYLGKLTEGAMRLMARNTKIRSPDNTLRCPFGIPSLSEYSG